MDKSNSNHHTNYPSYQYTSVIKDGGEEVARMRGARRVVTFCLLAAVLPGALVLLPLYLRHVRYAAVTYRLADSDVIQIHDGQSSIFCQKHSLSMNSTFQAFQMKGTPEISDSRKHIRLKKSMSLPDDTIEYWGFYLLRGATVELQACSRYEGSRILVVKGDKVLNTCGIIDYHSKVDPSLATDQGHVVVTLESPAELVDAEVHPRLKSDRARSNVDPNNLATAAEQTSEEVDQINDLDRAQLLAKDHINERSNRHHIKFKLDNRSMQDKRLAKNVTNEALLKDRKMKRDVAQAHSPHHVLDRGYNHGGNAIGRTNHTDHESSMSSFENSLLECYDGNILISNAFPYGEQCKSVQMIEKTTTLKISHDVLQDGYYYYIFYSDNDIVQNDIHAIFDIYKPTFQYANLSDSKVCMNKTECEFPVSFLSGELVIVEVPTKDGIEHEEGSWFTLTSTCHPRVNVYVIFPIAVMLFIIFFAFL